MVVVVGEGMEKNCVCDPSDFASWLGCTHVSIVPRLMGHFQLISRAALVPQGKAPITAGQ